VKHVDEEVTGFFAKLKERLVGSRYPAIQTRSRSQMIGCVCSLIYNCSTVSYPFIRWQLHQREKEEGWELVQRGDYIVKVKKWMQDSVLAGKNPELYRTVGTYFGFPIPAILKPAAFV